MIMKKYLFFAAAALTLAACSNENEEGMDNNTPVELKLTSGITVQTRTTHNLDEQLASGEKVHVWVDDAGNEVSLYANNPLVANGNGSFTNDTDTKTMYFPSTGNDVDIYAIHGNLGTADFSNFWGTEQTHTVSDNQQSDNGNKGYAQSDLVFAKSVNVGRDGNPTTVNLDFTHLLSKLEVVLVQGAGAPTIDKVEILNTQLQAKFTPSKDVGITVTAAGGINQTSNAIEIDNGTTSKEIADKTGDDEGKVLNEAIIVPQTLVAGTAFIRLTTDKGGVLTYQIPAEGKSFAGGTKYRYTITANLTGLEVKYSVSNWTPAEEEGSGSAEMQ